MGSSLEEFITDAVDEILAHEDFTRFRTWVEEEGPRRQRQWARLVEPERRSRAQRLARALWNATPLPGNGLRPKPLPGPERNDPCPCGSGVKYKKCCAAAEREAAPLQLDPEAMLSLVAERLDPFRAAELSESLSPGAATEMATRLFELGGPRAALAMVENRFAEPAKAGPRDAEALAVMLDCYGELGLADSLRSLVARLAADLPPALHGVLWEVGASAAARAGDLEGAWQALDQAHSLEPDNPRLDPLAVTFLISADDYEEAAKRARKALERVRRERLDLPAETLDLLADVAAEPAATHRRLALDAAEPYVARFESWLAKVADRPLPPYTVEPMEGEARAGRLVAPPEVAAMEDRWIDAYYGVAFEDEDEDEDDFDDDDLEDDEGFEDSGDDDFEDGDEDEDDFDDDEEEDDDFDDDDPLEEDQWNAENAETWLAFLESQPESFDSVAVLSDLAGIVGQVTYERSRRIGVGLLQPLLTRAAAILDRATAAAPGLMLPADEPDNEAALKLLAEALSLPEQAARPYLDRLLVLDPSDPFLLRETEEPM